MGDGVVKPRFAWSLPTTEARALGSVRRWSGLETLERSPLVWLRAGRLEDEQWELVRRLPGADRYTVLDDGQLLPVGGIVPRGRLPDGVWQPLDRWLAVELPTADEPAAAPSPASLQLVRSVVEREATWLQTSLAAWTAYVALAPQVRLARWSFVADRRGRIVVRGAPLPPLPGLRFVDHSGIVVPVGFTWSPHLPADVLRETFDLQKDDSLLWTPDGACERIAADDWVQATRSAARLTRDAAPA
jgi:hypothetical protein